MVIWVRKSLRRGRRRRHFLLLSALPDSSFLIGCSDGPVYATATGFLIRTLSSKRKKPSSIKILHGYSLSSLAVGGSMQRDLCLWLLSVAAVCCCCLWLACVRRGAVQLHRHSS